jgi:hypothetical protein
VSLGLGIVAEISAVDNITGIADISEIGKMFSGNCDMCFSTQFSNDEWSKIVAMSRFLGFLFFHHAQSYSSTI